ncbi:hypothetical protein Cgig2_004966 [Carnegiea gigantea]|uniref:Uncharacterized protein n=1 Tax=Carnegiea gigantea TaxID=171969 RepID=A0A9Q1KZ91_9CARY|nr:hypothetical protein Cgig2_004966 [Carnegiea gigantea]
MISSNPLFICKFHSPYSILRSQLYHKRMAFLSDKNIINTLYKPLTLTGFFLLLFYIFLCNLHLNPPSLKYNLAELRRPGAPPPLYDDENITSDSHPTNISHIVIAIASSFNSFKFRKPYIESWWRPNVTRGYLFLDRHPSGFLPWAPTSPPYRISEDTSRYNPYDRHPMRDAIRMLRVFFEAFREAREGVRWYVMTDDDTILFLDNLLDVLSKYDHTKYFYIGENSETVQSNFDHSFEMAFGGGGYAVSYPLAEALAKNLDVCIKRYPSLYGSDHMMQSCVADLGVSLTHEKGFHQIDLRKDISGFLASLAQSPLVSLHHIDAVNPLFPSMSRTESLNHLMKAARLDQSRLLQQTICYESSRNWSFSIAWGYSAQVYESIIPPSVLVKPLETFSPWRKGPKQAFMFNTRWLSNNPCEMPHDFYLESVDKIAQTDEIITSYSRRSPRRMPPCSSSTSSNHTSSDLVGDIQKIIVLSPPTSYSAAGGSRRECCDILDQVEKNVTMIKYRACMKDEITGVE